MEPIKLEIFMKDLTRTGMQSVKGNLNDIRQNTLAVISLLEKELGDMQAKARQAASQGMVDKKQMADIQAMTGMVKGLKDGLKDLEKQKQQTNETPVVGNNASVGIDDISKKTNNLKLQFSQVARELPSLALGPQMFILAISNNLPMLADAIRDVRVQNELMAKSGQKAVPVWKQLAGSLFSWQTGLVVAISLGIVYAKDIANWTKELVNGKKAVDNTKKALEEYNKTLLESEQDAQKEIVQLNLLYKAATDTSKGMRERNTAVKELKKEFPQYFKNLSDEEILVGKASGKYQELAQAIMATARAQAARDTLVKNSADKLVLEEEITAGYTKRDTVEKAKNNALTQLKERQKQTLFPVSNDVIRETERSYDKQLEEIDKGIEERRKKIYDLNKFDRNLAEQVNVADLVFDPNEDDKSKSSGKSALDYQNELADARVRAQQRLEAARNAVMEDGYKKRQALARREMDEAIALIDKEERDTLLKMEEAKKKKGVETTPEEKQAVKDTAGQNRFYATEKYIKEYAKAEKEWQNENLQSWIDYNKQYGTYQQKRLAITQEYNLKMQKEGLTDGGKAIFAKERDVAYQELDFSKLKKDMNWELIFGNLDQVAKKELQKVKQQLVAFKNSPEFKSISNPEQIKVIEDALNDLNTALVDKSGFFGGLDESMTEYLNTVKETAKAQEELTETLKTGDEAAQEKARQNLEEAKKKQVSAKINVGQSQDKAIKNINAVSDAMKQLGSENLSLSQIGSTVENLVEVLGKSGSKIGGIISAILSIIDTIGEKGVTNFVGDLVGNIGSSLFDAAKKDTQKVTKIATFGLVDFGWGEDEKKYNELKEKYEGLLKIWDDLLGKKKEYLSATTADETNRVEEETLGLINKQTDAVKKMAEARLMVKNGSHSMWYRMWKGSYKFDGQNWQDVAGEIEKTYGVQFNEMKDMLNMSPEVLQKIKENYSGLWTVMDGEFKGYLEQLIEYGDQAVDIIEQAKESLTQVSFDNLKDGFLNTLMDMDSSAEDFADDFSSYMQKAILNTMLAKSYEGRLQEWYTKFADANRHNEGGKTNIGKDEYKELQDEWNKIVGDALAERDSLKDLFGWKGNGKDETQSGRAGSITTITEQTGGEISGTLNVMLDYDIARNKLLEELKASRAEDSKVFADIAENTAYCKLLQPMLDVLERFEMNGMKMKG